MGLPTGFTNGGMPGSKAKDSHVKGSKHTKALSIKRQQMKDRVQQGIYEVNPAFYKGTIQHLED